MCSEVVSASLKNVFQIACSAGCGQSCDGIPGAGCSLSSSLGAQSCSAGSYSLAGCGLPAPLAHYEGQQCEGGMVDGALASASMARCSSEEALTKMLVYQCSSKGALQDLRCKDLEWESWIPPALPCLI